MVQVEASAQCFGSTVMFWKVLCSFSLILELPEYEVGFMRWFHFESNGGIECDG